jgi:hypothetical protein
MDGTRVGTVSTYFATEYILGMNGRDRYPIGSIVPLPVSRCGCRRGCGACGPVPVAVKDIGLYCTDVEKQMLNVGISGICMVYFLLL